MVQRELQGHQGQRQLVLKSVETTAYILLLGVNNYVDFIKQDSYV